MSRSWRGRLAPASIHLSAIRHAQIIRGHPEPREGSSLPRLRLIQTGIRRERTILGPPTFPPRLHVTPPLLRPLTACRLRRAVVVGCNMLLRVLPGWRDHRPESNHLRSGHLPCCEPTPKGKSPDTPPLASARPVLISGGPGARLCSQVMVTKVNEPARR